MCGISGIINFNSATCNANALVNMTQSMINRRPDDEGYILVDDRFNNNIKVVLSGLGGDELFDGYDVCNKLKYWNRLKPNHSIINRIPFKNNKLNRIKLITNFKKVIDYYSHYYSTFSDAEINTLFGTKYHETNSILSHHYNHTNLNFANDFNEISYYNPKSYIRNHQMRTLDQFTMHFSIREG